MSILNKIQATLGRKQEAAGTTLERFAKIPLRQMRRREPPFDDWRSPETKIPSVLEDLFEGYARLYQLYVFYRLTARRFGFEIADHVLQYQVESISKTSSEMGTLLERAIRRIHTETIHHINEPQAAARNGSETRAPVEHRIATEFLTVGDAAPFYARQEDDEPGRTRGMNGTASELAECLAHAKISARNHFQPIVETIRIEFR